MSESAHVAMIDNEPKMRMECSKIPVRFHRRDGLVMATKHMDDGFGISYVGATEAEAVDGLLGALVGILQDHGVTGQANRDRARAKSEMVERAKE